MLNLRHVFLALVIVVFAAPLFAADMGESQGRDLDALWAAAQEKFDTGTEDAVLLLESREVTLNADGTKSTRVHTVVWITSSVGIRGYADLRIPWDKATSEFEVEVLRTWMDERWWPDAERISDTAVVHTLPHALRTAHDYTTMRETMLLHDGVELPCIMETVYTITEKMPFDYTDGLMVIPQRDPAVRVELTVAAPTGVEVKHEAMNGAPEAVVTNADGQLVMTWAMDDVAPLKMPIAAAPERYEPAVVWSTWPDWKTVAETWHRSIAEATQVDEVLQEEIQTVYADSPDWAALAGFPDWINEAVRPTHYDAEHWFGRPRTSTRTWETGYGHAMDRMILMNAWGGNSKGIPEICWFVGEPGPVVAGDVPRLGGLGKMMYGNLGKDGQGGNKVYYDPDRGTAVSTTEIWGCPVYLFGQEGAPFVSGGEANPLENKLALTLTLERGEEGGFSGRGTIETGGILTDRFAWTSGTTSMADLTRTLLTSVLHGADLGEVNPLALGRQEAKVAFAFTLPVIEEDEFGVKRLVLGAPIRGVSTQLPADVHLQDSVRQSPVILRSPMFHWVKVRFKREDLGIASLPGEMELVNSAGNVHVKVEEYQGWTTFSYGCSLKRERFGPDQWPELRALLLEDRAELRRTIIFE